MQRRNNLEEEEEVYYQYFALISAVDSFSSGFAGYKLITEQYFSSSFFR